MLSSLLRFSLTQRVFIAIMAFVLMAMGAKAWLNLPIDAFPDISPTQVKIIIKAPGMTTTEIESQITRLIETELLGIPSQEMLRSTTKYAITDITIDFDKGVDIYWARQQVNERLMNIWGDLPDNISGGVAPMSTPLSEMFMFTLNNPNLDLTELRELLDWHIRPILRSVSGVADVNSLGGFVKTYELVPNFIKMQSMNISLADIEIAIKNNNLNMGLGKIEIGNDTLVVRTQGQFLAIDDIKQLVIRSRNNAITRLSDIVEVKEGHLTRYGAVSHDGKEAVQGLVIALKNSNTADVVAQVKNKLKEIQPSLPVGTEINIFYDRSNLIETAIDTITSALGQAVLLVVILLALFLGNYRAAIVVSLSLPMAALATFLLMEQFGISANLMSLGGLVIAIGMLVDSSVVVVENMVSQLNKDNRLPKLHIIYRSANQVAVPVVAGTSIVIIVFSPLLTLTGLEGKLFTPVALTIVFAMISSLLIALTLIPVIASVLLGKGTYTEPKIVLKMQQFYKRTLEKTINNPKPLLALVLSTLLLSFLLFDHVGKSFMPTLDEGDVIVQLEKSPSISLQSSIDLDKQVELALLEQVPEIVQIIARTGSDELGLDPMGLNETDVFMELLPTSEWRFETKAELIDAIRDVVVKFPGMNINFTQPIQMRVSEMLTGGSGDVSIKIFGNQVHELAQLAEQISTIASKISGSEDVQSALIEGGKYLNIQLRPEVAKQFGLSVEELSHYLKGQLEGRVISEVIENNKFTPILFSNSQNSNKLSQISTIADIKQQLILMPNNQVLPLSVVATVGIKQGPLLIEREKGKRFVSVSSNVKGRDVVSFVEELKQQINANVDFPSGYTVTFGGEFENQQRAMNNLLLVIPIALVLIFIILFSTFRSINLSFLILANIPFALMGGIISLYISNQYLSVPASVGFIALLGIAVLNGVVMVSYFEQSKMVFSNLNDLVLQGAIRRIRPVMMTATTAMFGLFPLIYATGPGAEIQKPLAIVVIGGLITSTVTTLYLLPIFYRLMEKKNG